MRYEFKYIVPSSTIPKLKEMIAPFVAIDEFALKGETEGYTVRSIYFDTADLLFYREKMEGVPNRIKLRIRGYNTPEVNRDVFFEIKRKHRIPLTKNRAKTTYDDMVSLMASEQELDEVFADRSPKTQDSAQRFFFNWKSRNLLPVVLVTYDRLPFHSVVNDTIRITFDMNLRSKALPAIDQLYTNDLDTVMESYFILEVKFNKKYPTWMRKVVNTLNLKQSAASKYCLCIDNHPGLVSKHQHMIRSEAALFQKDRA